MSALGPLLLSLGILVPAEGKSPASGVVDVARLREMLQDRQHPSDQSQAALLLVQCHSSTAADIVRQGLEQKEAVEVFTALADAVRLCRDPRFTAELLAGLGSGKALVRQAAVETLAVLADGDLVHRLQRVAENGKADPAMRQAALAALGRTGRKEAAAILLEQLDQADDALYLAAADALADLTGLAYGPDPQRWRTWWKSHKNMTDERWLEERFAYQASRARRLEGELDRAKAQVVRLHQQFYSRLPAADRLGHVQTLADHEDASVRALAVVWGIELLSAADAVGQRALADLLLRLSGDAALEVQRSAVIALGRVHDPRAFEQLQELLRRGRPPVRAAAVRGLAQQATGSGPITAADPGSYVQALRHQVVPALQKALEDSALEVVVEAAEDLGTLGVPEAGPVLIALLHHSSETVRQAAAQALERVAGLDVLDDLLKALDDSAVTVRFSLVGALGHAASDGQKLADAQRDRTITRLQDLLVHDADPGVRSRAATVLGECAAPAVLPILWERVLAAEDARVQDKAWTAILAVVLRANNLELLNEWDRILTEAKQGPRRLHLLAAACDDCKKKEDSALLVPATEALIQAQLDEGKWAAAFPLVRELLARPANDADKEKRLRWLLKVGDQALQEGNHADTKRVLQEAQPYVAHSPLNADFEKLQRKEKATNTK